MVSAFIVLMLAERSDLHYVDCLRRDPLTLTNLIL